MPPCESYWNKWRWLKSVSNSKFTLLTKQSKDVRHYLRTGSQWSVARVHHKEQYLPFPFPTLYTSYNLDFPTPEDLGWCHCQLGGSSMTLSEPSLMPARLRSWWLTSARSHPTLHRWTSKTLYNNMLDAYALVFTSTTNRTGPRIRMHFIQIAFTC